MTNNILDEKGKKISLIITISITVVILLFSIITSLFYNAVSMKTLILIV